MYVIQNRNSERRIIFHGNSLFGRGTDQAAQGKGISGLFRTRLISNGKRYPVFDYSVGGRRTPDMPTDYAAFQSTCRPNDIIIVWELTNDMANNAPTAQQAYDNLANYCTTLKNAGLYVVVLTCIARDNTGLVAGFDTLRQSVNTLVRASTVWDKLIDIAALPEFDAVADCANTTYYDADKLHLALVGYQLVEETIYNELNGVI